MRKASLDNDLSAVKTILADLAGREVNATKERTNVFTRSVIEYMGASTEMRSEPDQQAAFRVLKTAQFPSVLIELAYVTNKEDAALLQSDTWRDKVSRFDHDSGRELLQQSDRAPADVRWRFLRSALPAPGFLLLDRQFTLRIFPAHRFTSRLVGSATHQADRA